MLQSTSVTNIRSRPDRNSIFPRRTVMCAYIKGSSHGGGFRSDDQRWWESCDTYTPRHKHVYTFLFFTQSTLTVDTSALIRTFTQQWKANTARMLNRALSCIACSFYSFATSKGGSVNDNCLPVRNSACVAGCGRFILPLNTLFLLWVPVMKTG